MDPEDVQDLLFDTADIHESLEVLWDDSYDNDDLIDAAGSSQGSDDDDLFEAVQRTAANDWQLLSSPPLTPEDTPITAQYDTLLSSVEHPTTAGEKTHRDRCSRFQVKRRKC